MNTMYRLPDALGGAEVEVLHGFARGDGLVDCKVEGLGVVSIPYRWLIHIEAPAEPPVGSFVWDRQGNVWHRHPVPPERPWKCGDESHTWVELQKRRPLTKLIPDPTVDAPTLPASIPTYGGLRDLRIELRAGGHIFLYTAEGPEFGRSARLTEEHARQAAAALWCAAEQAKAAHAAAAT